MVLQCFLPPLTILEDKADAKVSLQTSGLGQDALPRSTGIRLWWLVENP